MRETFEALIARMNRSAFIPPADPTGSGRQKSIMPKPVKLAKGHEFTFATPKTGGETKYDWDSWFSPDPKAFPNGLVHLQRHTGPENDKGTIEDDKAVEKGDFGVSVNAMVPKINTAARRRYKVVQISRNDNTGKRLVDALIIKGRDMTPEERADEDVLRTEEKAEKLARRKAEVAAAAAQAAAPATNGTATATAHESASATAAQA